MKTNKLGRLQHLILCFTLSLSACISTSLNNWPSDLPAQAVFIDAWQKQNKAGTNDSTKKEHLVWVRRFYEGSILYPIGWNDMIQSVANSITSTSDKLLIERRLKDLGLAICIEWAKNNRDRKIDSAAIAVWGDALRTAAQRQEQSDFIDKVETDVNALLTGKLQAAQIHRERYYPPQNYDNF